MPTPVSITHICTLENSDLEYVAVNADRTLLAGIEDNYSLYLYDLTTGTNINGPYVEHLNAATLGGGDSNSGFYGVTADGAGNWYLDLVADLGASAEEAVLTFSGSSSSISDYTRRNIPDDDDVKGWQLGWHPVSDVLWAVSTAEGSEQIAIVDETGWNVVYDNAVGGVSSFVNPWNPVPKYDDASVVYTNTQNETFGIRWDGSLSMVQIDPVSSTGGHPPVFARDVCLYPANQGLGVTGWYEHDGVTATIANYLKDLGVDVGPAHHSYDMRYTYLVEFITGRVWQIDWLGDPTPEPVGSGLAWSVI